MKKALLLVDIQNGFCPKGTLPVTDGDKILPEVINLMKSGNYDYIVATQDWHPAGHISYASTHGVEPYTMKKIYGKEEMLWTDHCLQNTEDADFHPTLKNNFSLVDDVVQKGMDLHVDSYSGFFDNGDENGHRKDTGLDALLKKKGIEEIHVVGLAYDVCVKFTAIDGHNLGYKTTIIERGCKAVNLEAIDSMKQELRDLGITIEE